jgi:hypothetical protein
VIRLTVHVVTHNGLSREFVFDGFAPATRADAGVRVALSGEMPCRVETTPPAGDALARVSYRLTTPLRNYHEVIVPDTGRSYSTQTQLVGFWGSRQRSRANNVRMPVYILTGLDGRTALAFGVIGENFETDFLVREPAQRRALVAWMKRLTLEIRRGTDDYPIPASATEAQDDGALIEHLYLLDGPRPGHETYLHTLRDFAAHLARIKRLAPRTTDAALEPYWCSWTDWFSGDVTAEVILDNVREGVKLGIRNYIIDDGWFGPALDNDLDVALNIGDWREDAAKIPDLRALVREVQAEGGRAIIWCAPHAVAPAAECFAGRRRLLIADAAGEYLMTPNGFHSLCFMCPEARETMAGLCASLIERYGVDGAKYDLFNCVADAPCRSREHAHDTSSMIEGLARTLRLIDERTRAVRGDYLTELKQNYATPHLYACGTCVRAGDTPYNAEGNFLRTAYVNAYTPYSLNDYQTINNHDAPAAAAAIVVKMLAVGIPAYSMDLPALAEPHRRLLLFLHGWYAANLDAFRGCRTPLDPQLRSWIARGGRKNIYFVLDSETRLALPELKDSDVAVGSFAGRVDLELPAEADLAVEVAGPDGTARRETHAGVRRRSIPARPGEIVKLTFPR